MFRSAEVRWFFEGELPGAVCKWFEAGGRVKTEPERTDEYLALPGCVTTGVKFRDGRLEVKAQTEPPVVVEFPGVGSGQRDAWVKWSSATLDADESRQRIVRAEDEWIAVSKRRRLRLVSLESDEAVEVAPDHGWLSGGCQVELTAIQAGSREQGAPAARPWWSLSFEAFGNQEAMHDGLDHVIRTFLERPPPVSLNQEASFSYPVWLSMLKKHRG